jgi:photosystem II stability/assembly factor-like uncharacterized protein
MARLLRFAAALALVAGVGAVQAASPLAAISTKKAHKSLLLDVARAGNRLVAVGERGHVILSDDAGATWRQAPVPVRSLLTAVYFVTPTDGWAVGHDSVVLATRDAGATWTLQHYKEFNPAAAGDAVVEDAAADEMSDEEYLDDAALEEDTGGREIPSRDGVPLLDVWFSDTRNGVAVGAYGLLLRTTDGGKTWVDASENVANRDGWHFNAVSGIPGDGGAVFIAGEKGILYRSVDGGNTFAPLASPYQGSFFGLTPLPGGSVYAYGLQGSLFRSDDRGGRWVRVETGVTSGLNDGCVRKDGTLVIAGNAGVILTGAPGGTAFTTIRRPDRQSVLSCVDVGSDAVLVGEGGAKFASAQAANKK